MMNMARGPKFKGNRKKEKRNRKPWRELSKNSGEREKDEPQPSSIIHICLGAFVIRTREKQKCFSFFVFSESEAY
jgi:hypothetical protein